MAITATYKDKILEVKNAYIRVERIWGSKKEGWNCWVHVYEKEGDLAPVAPVFSVNAPYIEGQNPFEALYKAIEQLPFIELPVSKEEIVKITPEVNKALKSALLSSVEVVEPKEEKKPRGKKVKA